MFLAYFIGEGVLLSLSETDAFETMSGFIGTEAAAAFVLILQAVSHAIDFVVFTVLEHISLLILLTVLSTEPVISDDCTLFSDDLSICVFVCKGTAACSIGACVTGFPDVVDKTVGIEFSLPTTAACCDRIILELVDILDEIGTTEFGLMTNSVLLNPDLSVCEHGSLMGPGQNTVDDNPMFLVTDDMLNIC